MSSYAKMLVWSVIIFGHTVLAMDRNEWAGKLMRKIKFGEKVSVDILEDDNDDGDYGMHRKPNQNRTFASAADPDFPHDSVEDFSEDVGKNALNFKLSDILKLIEKLKKPNVNDRESKAENQSRLSILDKLFKILQSKFKADDFELDDPISFAEIKRFLSEKFQKSISIGCLGDLLYFADSLMEYGMARRDLSHVCQKPPSSGSLREHNNTLDCDCTSKVQSILDENEWTLDEDLAVSTITEPLNIDFGATISFLNCVQKETFIDSIGKFPSGLTKGNLWFLGDFEQCTEISVDKRSKKHRWEGRYSRIDFFIYKDKLYSPFIENDRKGIFSDVEAGLNVIQLPSSLPECNVFFQVKYGACFPKTCTKEDLETIIEYVVNIPQKLLKKRVVCASNVLYHDSPSIFDDFPALIVAFIVLLFILLGLFGTLYDWRVHSRFDQIVYHEMSHNLSKEKSESNATEKTAKTPLLIEVLLAFSIYKNAKKIFDMSPDSTKDHVKCIHGIRALSIIWVIYAHSYSAGTLFVDNAFDILAVPNNIMNQLILNATLAVDAFFFMSGTLLAYLALKRLKSEDGKHAYDWRKWSQLLAHRYLRLTPVYAFVLFVQIFLIRYTIDGPLWNPGGFESKVCRTGWWTNLAYINNLISLDRSCMVWSWYLANDTQFFVLSIPLVILLWANGTLGILAISLLIVATSIIRGVIVMSNEAFPPINIFYNDLEKLQSTEEFTYKVYFSPHCRIGPYLVGLLIGYILFKYRKSFKLSMISNVLLWTASFAMGLGVLFGMYEFCKTGRISDVGKAIYGSSCRVLWSLLLAWIVLASSTGHGGFINNFLSSKRWKPISRLVYSAYLVHPIIMLLFYTSFMKPIHYEGHYQVLGYFFGHIVLTFFFAFWVSCLVEMPLANLEQRLFFGKRRESSGHENHVTHNHLHLHTKPTRSVTTQKLLSNDEETVQQNETNNDRANL